MNHLAVWSWIECPIHAIWSWIGCPIFTAWSDMRYSLLMWSGIGRHVMRKETDENAISVEFTSHSHNLVRECGKCLSREKGTRM